jgi:hypothetical protein
MSPRRGTAVVLPTQRKTGTSRNRFRGLVRRDGHGAGPASHADLRAPRSKGALRRKLVRSFPRTPRGGKPPPVGSPSDGAGSMRDPTSLGRSTEGERKRSDTRFQELDLEGPLDAAMGLADQLIEPLARDDTFSGVVDVDAVVAPGRLAIEGHSKRHRFAVETRSDDEMKVTAPEPEDDPTTRAPQLRPVLVKGPTSHETPLIDR